MWEDLLPNAMKTSARHDNDLLMLTVSLKRVGSLALPDLSALSDPARSTRRSPPLMTVALSVCFAVMSSMNRAWLLLLRSFIAVQATIRVLLAMSRSPSSCDTPAFKSVESSSIEVSPAIVTKPWRFEIFSFDFSLLDVK